MRTLKIAVVAGIAAVLAVSAVAEWFHHEMPASGVNQPVSPKPVDRGEQEFAGPPEGRHELPPATPSDVNVLIGAIGEAQDHGGVPASSSVAIALLSVVSATLAATARRRATA